MTIEELAKAVDPYAWANVPDFYSTAKQDRRSDAIGTARALLPLIAKEMASVAKARAAEWDKQGKLGTTMSDQAYAAGKATEAEHIAAAILARAEEIAANSR